MRKFLRYIGFCAAALCTTACIDNDIPYPVVELQITGVEGEGFSVAGVDLGQRRVTLQLDEATDIRNVQIAGATFDASFRGSADKQTYLDRMQLSREVKGTFDLRTPLYVTLSLYQDYEWTILAQQTIERRFRVEGQVGSEAFDTENRLVSVRVSKDTDLSRLKVTDLKLGPDAITRYSPTLTELSGTNFEGVRFVDVTCHDRTERWTLQVTAADETVVLRQADAWSRVLWLYGEGVTGGTVGFRYRVKGAEQWTTVSSQDPDSPVTVTGGSFSLRLTVEPETTYEIKAFCDGAESEPVERTTEGVRQLPNCDMETWSKPKAPWLPFASDADGNPIDPFWGSGNNGATVIGSRYNVTTPVSDLPPQTSGQYAAQLESTYVVYKLAAGNLFTGEFVGLRNLSHGIVNFGRPFTLRPTAMRLWVKYKRGILTDVKGQPVGSDFVVGKTPDNGSVYIALGTWTKEEYGNGALDAATGKREQFGSDDCPVSIDTRDVTTFFNSESKDVVGYGARFFTEDTDGWERITIPIDYRGVTDRRPTHIIVVCSASRWGDYFTGSRDSKMWVDEIELLYD